MAHAVAPIPSLVEICPDCPQDLEEVYETMLAKDPRERYAVPAEVAEAMAEFADAEELAEVIAAIPTDDAWIAASRRDLHSPEVDTAKQQGAGSVGSNARRRSTAGGLPGGDSAGMCCSPLRIAGGRDCSASWLGGDAARRRPSEESTESTAAGLSPAAAPRRHAADRRNQLAAELALLPGLNGPWWFEETPWLTPFLREAIAEKVLSSPDLAAVLGDHPQDISTPIRPRCRMALGSGRTLPRGPVARPIATVDHSRHSPTTVTTITRKRRAPSPTPCSSSATAITTRPGRPPISIPWRCCSTASPPWTTTTSWPWRRRRATTRPWRPTRPRKKRRPPRGCFASPTPPSCLPTCWAI